MKKNLELAKKYEEDIIGFRRDIHKNPEVGFYLPKTSKYIKEQLDKMGIQYRDCGKITKEISDKFEKLGSPRAEEATGILATIGSGEPVVLLRGDIDALPMEEKTGLPYASKNGCMHACGHDAHGAMLLGAAKILKEREDELKGTVKLMFQIGEELGYGSQLMIDDGLLENPKVDAAFAIHVNSQLDSGTVQYTKGVMTASMDSWEINIKGKGGHSSMPQVCIDPNVIANQIYQALNILPGREVDPSANLSFVVGVIEGGTAVNIIPDTARLSAGMRSLDIPSRDHLAPRVEEIVDHCVKMWRGEYTINHLLTPSTYCDGDLIEEMIPYLEEVTGKGNLVETGPIGGAEDFGYVTKQVPGMMLWLGAGNSEQYPLHNPNMVLDESVFKLGAALHATFAMEYLKNH
ncbi:MAG: M20 family metallopeptidase [Tissierellia bacterium]|nr:M20 family metallopeptidase [Tissierellia bacterium]